jgi:hypothetical protein
MGAFTWKPTTRDFDLLLVTQGSRNAIGFGSQGTMGSAQFMGLMQGFGAAISSDGRKLAGDFVLCDGPGMYYRLVLQGDRGLLRHDEAEFEFGISWPNAPTA